MKRCIQILLISLSCGVTAAADNVQELREQIKRQNRELQVMGDVIERLQAKLEGAAPKKKNDLAHKRKFIEWPLTKIKQEPSDCFLYAWILCRDAEKGLVEDRRDNLKTALKLYRDISNAAPDWKPHLVKARITSTLTSIEALENPN